MQSDKTKLPLILFFISGVIIIVASLLAAVIFGLDSFSLRDLFFLLLPIIASIVLGVVIGLVMFLTWWLLKIIWKAVSPRTIIIVFVILFVAFGSFLYVTGSLKYAKSHYSSEVYLWRYINDCDTQFNWDDACYAIGNTFSLGIPEEQIQCKYCDDPQDRNTSYFNNFDRISMETRKQEMARCRCISQLTKIHNGSCAWVINGECSNYGLYLNKPEPVIDYYASFTKKENFSLILGWAGQYTFITNYFWGGGH